MMKRMSKLPGLTTVFFVIVNILKIFVFQLFVNFHLLLLIFFSKIIIYHFLSLEFKLLLIRENKLFLTTS
jgi:hypothetical protein